MTNRFEQTLFASLDERAGAPVDTSALAEVTGRLGRRRRLRNHTVGGVALLAVAMAGTVGIVALRPGPADLPIGGPPKPSASAAQSFHVPGLPVATGVPGAATDPTLVGTDPTAVHFTVDDWTANSSGTTWSTGGGSEVINFHRDDTFYEVALARDLSRLDRLVLLRTGNSDTVPADAPPPTPEVTHQLTVQGVQATLASYGSGPEAPFALRWQPFAGVWAQVYGHGRGDHAAARTSIVAKLRLDTAYRCATPVRVTSPPAGAKLRTCSVAVSGDDLPDRAGNPVRLIEATFTFGVGSDYAELYVVRRLDQGEPSPSSSSGTSLAGHPSRETLNQLSRPTIFVSDFDGVQVALSGYGTYGYPALRAIGAGIRVTGDLLDPATWPERLIG